MSHSASRFDYKLIVEATFHANERISERLSMTTDEVLTLLNEGRGIHINGFMNEDHDKKAYLLYSDQDRDFFVAVMAINHDNKQLSLLTVLPENYYENLSDKPIGKIAKLRAVRAATSVDNFNAWKRRERLQRKAVFMENLDVVSLYCVVRSPGGNERQVKLDRCRVEKSHAVDWSFEFFLSIPGFGEMVRSLITKKRLKRHLIVDLFAQVGDKEIPLMPILLFGL